MNNSDTLPPAFALDHSYVEDMKLAASKMAGAERRLFQAEMTVKYYGGSARRAESLFGWGRQAIELGLHERRTGIRCVGAQKVYGGNHLWEERHPAVAHALWTLAQAQSQQDPTFRTTLSYTRLTAAEALRQLRSQGFAEDVLPSPSTMAAVLNRNGYRLRAVLKAKCRYTSSYLIDFRSKNMLGAHNFHVAQQVGVDRMRRMAAARVGLSVQRFDAHLLHQCRHVLAANLMPLLFEQVAQHAAAGKWIFQM